MAQDALGEGVAPQKEAQEPPQHTTVGFEAESLAAGARVHLSDASSLAMELLRPDALALGGARRSLMPLRGQMSSRALEHTCCA